MNSLTKKLLTYSIFAAAMAYLESAIVVYLRDIFYPDGFQFPIKIIQDKIAIIEVGREAATIIMLWFITRMASEKFKEQFALFLFSFGVWDIFYYLWLKIFINWPGYWLEWDILFLIPIPWVGPWLAPVLISIGFIITAVLALKYPERFGDKIYSVKEWLFLMLSAAIILESFLWESDKVLASESPEYYPWWLFAIGYILGLGVFFHRFRQKQN